MIDHNHWACLHFMMKIPFTVNSFQRNTFDTDQFHSLNYHIIKYDYWKWNKHFVRWIFILNKMCKYILKIELRFPCESNIENGLMRSLSVLINVVGVFVYFQNFGQTKSYFILINIWVKSNCRRSESVWNQKQMYQYLRL